jgi:hypothetical protein
VSETRLDKWKVLLVFGAGLAIVVLVANVVVLLSTPETQPAPCAASPACPPPVEPLAAGERWTSTALGYSFEYEGPRFSIASQDARGVNLRLELDRLPEAALGGSRDSVSLGEIWVTAAPASERTPQQLLAQRRDELAQRVLGLEEDSASGTTILGPSIGHLDGFGGSYVGTLDAQGPAGRAVVAIIAAGNQRISVVFSYVLGGTTLSANQSKTLRERGDLILSTFRWPA